ncbi:site-specific DNA-methyltransferase [Enterobacter kobei]|uniref:site-specific DNA-methyltransferase n=1 Tax=Enterobacter kobei TaxID=208224 RepID=UPI0018F7ACA6|nr:site-specific DNA-methyltransferase [Enterobacter kobei]
MATGINKSEQLSIDSLLADSAKSEPFALPTNDQSICFVYPNKISKDELLKPVKQKYIAFEKDSKKYINSIPTDSLILADNYFGLKKLLETYTSKVKLIYLDPPYGTGMDFQSRDLKHAYRDVMGTAPWLEFIRRRLIFMRELLANDGSIYIHIGHQMLFHLKVIMDEVFGEDNFRNLIVRKKCSSKNYTKNQYPNINDYILFYSKSKNMAFDNPGMPAELDWISKEYNKKDEKGLFKLVPIHAPGTRNGETGKAWRGMNPPPGKHWQMSPEKLEELANKGEIHWSKTGNPRRKVYLPQDKKLPLTDYWDKFRDAHHQSIKITGYPTEKNFDMLKKIIEASTVAGDLVLDPFCGSGTTLHAAQELDRKWLGIDQSFQAIVTSIRRLNFGLEPMGDFVNTKPAVKNEVLKLSDKEFNFIVDDDVYTKHTKEIELLLNEFN